MAPSGSSYRLGGHGGHWDRPGKVRHHHAMKMTDFNNYGYHLIVQLSKVSFVVQKSTNILYFGVHILQNDFVPKRIVERAIPV